MQLPLISALAATTSAHAVLRSIEGDNRVTMPVMGITDGTPRDCFSNTCGSQADSAILRDTETNSGKYGRLGWSPGKGNIFSETVIGAFMGEHHDIPTNQGDSGATGVEENIPFGLGTRQGRMANHNRNVGIMLARRQDTGSLGNVFKTISSLPVIGFGGLGGRLTNYPKETLVSDTAGADTGLPTPDENGILTMTWRQVNQDGAGLVSAAIDYTTGGQDFTAFEGARLLQINSAQNTAVQIARDVISDRFYL